MAKLNVTKSHGLLLGTWAFRGSLPVALDWSSHSIMVMEATLMNMEDDYNWNAALEQLNGTLVTWRQRRLPYHGCALVLISLGLSTLWYLASPLTMSSAIKKASSAPSCWLGIAYSIIWRMATSSSMALVPWFCWHPCLSASHTGGFPVWLVRIIVAWQSSVHRAWPSISPAFSRTSTSGVSSVLSGIPTGSSPTVSNCPVPSIVFVQYVLLIN